MSKHSKSKKKNIYDEYRRILQKPDLTKEEIDKMRMNIGRLAQIVYEYVWESKRG